jgi:hypothetical protein
MLKQGRENSACAKRLAHINTLNPPKISIAPIAPFVSEQQLADRRPIHLGHIIGSLGGIVDQRLDAFENELQVKRALFGFQRQLRVELGDGWRVSESGLSDVDFDGP